MGYKAKSLCLVKCCLGILVDDNCNKLYGVIYLFNSCKIETWDGIIEQFTL